MRGAKSCVSSEESASAEQKQLAEQIAKNTGDVKKVNNELVVHRN